jgi:hypothetical protein
MAPSSVRGHEVEIGIERSAARNLGLVGSRARSLALLEPSNGSQFDRVGRVATRLRHAAAAQGRPSGFRSPGIWAEFMLDSLPSTGQVALRTEPVQAAEGFIANLNL